MRHKRRIAGRGDEEKINRCFQHNAFADVNVGSVFRKSRIQRRERVALNVQISAEVSFDNGGMDLNLVRQAVHRHPDRQFLNHREFVNKMYINEYQLAGRAWDAKLLQFMFGDLGSRCQLERSARNRGYAGESPVFVVRGREANFAKTGKGIFAELAQPRQAAPRGPLLEFREAVQVSS